MFARAVVRRFPVLGYRDFRLLLADRLLAPAAFGFSLVGVSFAVLYTTGSTADLSYVLAAQIAPSLIFTLVGGVFADRFPPQWVIVAANIMIAVGEGAFGLLVLAGHPQLWQMIVLETLTGTGMAIFYPAAQAIVPRLVPGDLVQEAVRHQPHRDERRPDGRCRRGRPVRGRVRPRLGAGSPAASACWARCRCC